MADLGIIFLRRKHTIHWYQSLFTVITGSMPFRYFWATLYIPLCFLILDYYTCIMFHPPVWFYIYNISINWIVIVTCMTISCDIMYNAVIWDDLVLPIEIAVKCLKSRKVFCQMKFTGISSSPSRTTHTHTHTHTHRVTYIHTYIHTHTCTHRVMHTLHWFTPQVWE